MWVLALRIVGVAVFIVAGVIPTLFHIHNYNRLYINENLFGHLGISFGITIICFALAEGLKELKKLNERTAKHSAAFRYLLKSSQTQLIQQEQFSQPLSIPLSPALAPKPSPRRKSDDLAPVAPQWADLPDPLFESMEERKQWERLIAHRKAMMGE